MGIIHRDIIHRDIIHRHDIIHRDDIGMMIDNKLELRSHPTPASSINNM